MSDEDRMDALLRQLAAEEYNRPPEIVPAASDGILSTELPSTTWRSAVLRLHTDSTSAAAPDT